MYKDLTEEYKRKLKLFKKQKMKIARKYGITNEDLSFLQACFKKERFMRHLLKK